MTGMIPNPHCRSSLQIAQIVGMVALMLSAFSPDAICDELEIQRLTEDRWRVPAPIRDGFLVGDSKHIVIQTTEGGVFRLDVHDGSCVQLPIKKELKELLVAGAALADEELLVFFDDGRFLTVGANSVAPSTTRSTSMSKVHSVENGFATGREESDFLIFDVEKKKLHSRIANGGAIRRAVVSRDGTMVLTYALHRPYFFSSAKACVRLRNAVSGEILGEYFCDPDTSVPELWFDAKGTPHFCTHLGGSIVIGKFLDAEWHLRRHETNDEIIALTACAGKNEVNALIRTEEARTSLLCVYPTGATRAEFPGQDLDDNYRLLVGDDGSFFAGYHNHVFDFATSEAIVDCAVSVFDGQGELRSPPLVHASTISDVHAAADGTLLYAVSHGGVIAKHALRNDNSATIRSIGGGQEIEELAAVGALAVTTQQSVILLESSNLELIETLKLPKRQWRPSLASQGSKLLLATRPMGKDWTTTPVQVWSVSPTGATRAHEQEYRVASSVHDVSSVAMVGNRTMIITDGRVLEWKDGQVFRDFKINEHLGGGTHVQYVPNDEQVHMLSGAISLERQHLYFADLAAIRNAGHVVADYTSSIVSVDLNTRETTVIDCGKVAATSLAFGRPNGAGTLAVADISGTVRFLRDREFVMQARLPSPVTAIDFAGPNSNVLYAGTMHGVIYRITIKPRAAKR